MQIEIHQVEPKYAALRITDPERQSRLAASLLRHGQTSPVLVVPSAGEPQRYVLIDGYARVAALRELARDLVEAVALEMSAREALVLCHRLAASRPRSALEEGWLIGELMEQPGKSLVELAVELQRSASWVSRRMALVRVLPESVQEAVRQGVVPPYAAMKYLVPLARANRPQGEQLVVALGAKRISVRQMQRLYEGWRASDAEGRQRIVSHPHLYLKANEELTPSLLPVPEPTPVAGELEGVAALCRRARRQLRAGALQRLSPHQQQQVCSAWREAQMAFHALAMLIDAEDRHARSGHAERDLEVPPAGLQHPGDCQGGEGVSQRGAPGARERSG